ncbi:hypothetical protein BU15DRAFT_87245 [Melanogaster broomeanus]|nr:hypothetical protein BU15DRAFT_87245 [Melanogaster broomeanus]
MVKPKATIRPYKPDDEKLVRFTFGKAIMEGLAVANKRAALHPFTLSIWVAISCIMIQFMAWWPNTQHGWIGWLSPLPAFGCWGVPILFALDWYILRLTCLHRPDVADIQKYYSRSPSSGLFILEYGTKFIGLSFVKKDEDGKLLADKSKNFYSSGTSSTATIRHFFVDEPYRTSEVQDDLLEFAVRHAFTTTQDVNVIKVSATTLHDYAHRSLGRLGFTVEKHVRKIGVYGWSLDIMSLEKARWKKDESKRSST